MSSNGAMHLVGGCYIADALVQLGYSNAFDYLKAGDLTMAFNSIALGKANAMSVYGSFATYGFMDSILPKKSISIFGHKFAP